MREKGERREDAATRDLKVLSRGHLIALVDFFVE